MIIIIFSSGCLMSDINKTYLPTHNLITFHDFVARVVVSVSNLSTKKMMAKKVWPWLLKNGWKIKNVSRIYWNHAVFSFFVNDLFFYFLHCDFFNVDCSMSEQIYHHIHYTFRCMYSPPFILVLYFQPWRVNRGERRRHVSLRSLHMG